MVAVGIAFPACIGNLVSNFNVIYLSGYSYSKLDSIKDCSLIIFTGGSDINPEIYGQENIYSYFNSKRDGVELDILRVALELNKKILGICRGHQLINAYLGGYLIQDIETQLGTPHYGGHEIEVLEPDTIVTSSFKYVNSLHHQGVPVDGLGKGLTGTSFYNGVYESTENENIITVQFHPEFMGSNSSKFFEKIKSWAGEK